MGAISKIVSKVTSTVGKVAGEVGKVASTVSGVAGKITDFLQKPLSSLMAPLKGLADKALDKLPFGIGNLVKPFADKFMDKALSSLSGSSLGGLGFLAKAMPTISKIGDLAKQVGDIANKVGGFASPQGLSNIQNIFAHAQASKLE